MAPALLPREAARQASCHAGSPGHGGHARESVRAAQPVDARRGDTLWRRASRVHLPLGWPGWRWSRRHLPPDAGSATRRRTRTLARHDEALELIAARPATSI